MLLLAVEVVSLFFEIVDISVVVLGSVLYVGGTYDHIVIDTPIPVPVHGIVIDRVEKDVGVGVDEDFSLKMDRHGVMSG